MAQTFLLEVATPDRLLVREQVSEADIPLENGYIGVRPGHAPLLGEVGTGDLMYLAQGRRRHMVVDGGWVEVLGDHVRVLVDRAARADEIDVARAEESLKRARSRLARPEAGLDVARALNTLKRAQARLDAASQK
ncbi:MAG: ATP synthase F1 subunit epsilon [Acidobacteriales bacterium]|nr:MAG: ATP synthase F1 subunit epsilon [Terriglobales bacterium]